MKTMPMKEFANSKPVMDRYKEILEFYIEKNEENDLGIEQSELERVALERAQAEVYVEFCHDGIIVKPEKCTNCPCGIKQENSELNCSMAPPYVAHQPNLELFSSRPSYCPMNDHDEMQDAIYTFMTQPEGPIQ